MSTTPFEREILTHHFVGPSPFPRPTAIYRETVEKFVELGLLRMDGDKVVAVDEALRVYISALDEVPLPVLRWVMP